MMRVTIVFAGLLSIAFFTLAVAGGAAVIPGGAPAATVDVPVATTGGTPAGVVPTTDAAAIVDVFDFDYADADTDTPLTVVATGDTVTWSWSQGIHTVTQGAQPSVDVLPPGFDSGFKSPNDEDPTWSFTFEEPGVYPYYCTLHVTMRGVVVVA